MSNHHHKVYKVVAAVKTLCFGRVFNEVTVICGRVQRARPTSSKAPRCVHVYRKYLIHREDTLCEQASRLSE